MGSTQGVLDTMTAGIMGTKANKATSLTPVGSEKGGPLAGAVLPNDVPGQFLSNELLADISARLKADAAALLVVANGLDVLLGVDGPVAEHEAKEAAVSVKAAEREADRQAADRAKAAEGDKQAAERVAFAAKFNAQAEAAKASAFRAADAPAEGTAAEIWSCPAHGTAFVTTLTSRWGRTYRACTNCKEFEKP